MATRVVATVLLALAAPLAPAQEAEEKFDPSAVSIIRDTPEDLWRKRGLAHIDLPMGIRARFDAVYSRHLYSSDVLAQPFLRGFGPEIQGDRTLKSRIALTRPIVPGIELEIAWETRNSLAVSDPMGFERQTIGAHIRISP